MNNLRQLKEQLERCRKWLIEEPNDLEVIEKAKELENQIKEIELESEKKELEERKDNLYNEILECEKEIRAERRDFNYFKKFGKQNNINTIAMLQICANSIEGLTNKYKELGAEYQKLADEYQNLMNGNQE